MQQRSTFPFRHERFKRATPRRILAAFALTVLSCGLALGPHAKPQDYNQSCTEDTDCVPVWKKSCETPGCNCEPAGAVNKSEAERYNADESELRCVPPPPGGPSYNCFCVPFKGVCSSGKCGTTEGQPLSAGDGGI